MELFKDQRYDKLSKHHSDLGVPWRDPSFPTSDASIGLSKINNLPRNIQWKRPKDIVKEPRLCLDGTSAKDVTQGRLGNCWFVAACSVLAGCKEMWERVVPDAKDQEYQWAADEGSDARPPDDHSGVFRFRFWRFGKWIEVLVDDFLPTFTNDNDQVELLFTHSSSKREFWGSLLEKAYAKLHGSYGALDGGNLSDALVDFTSGISEMVDLTLKNETFQRHPEQKKELFDTLAHELDDHALMCAAITANNEDEMEQRTELGLVKGHAYGITAVKRIPLGETNLVNFFKGREKLALIRLQNPWGAKEWKGSFSDGSPEWTNISDKEKEKLGLTFDDDGDFWMPFDDFLLHFTEMSICRLINTSVFSLSKTWKETQLFGSWRLGLSSSSSDSDRQGSAPLGGSLNRAGGCLNHPESFLDNPQYRFDLPPLEDADEESEVIVQLSQSDARSALLTDKKDNVTIGFHIMEVESNRKCRVHQLRPESAVATSDYIKTKHIFLRATMPRTGGRFVIVPTTFKPGETTDFLLRIFTEHPANVKELKHDVPPVPWYKKCCHDQPSVVTRLTVAGVRGLENRERFGKIDPYAYVKCEGRTAKSRVHKDTLNPVWDFSVVFHRRDPSKPIKVQVWNHNVVAMDSFLGQCFLIAPPGGNHSEPKVETMTLVGRKSKRAEVVPGEIKIHVETYEDLMKI